MGGNVRSRGVERGKRPRALGATEGLCVAVLVTGQLNSRLEGFRAVRARVGALLAVSEKVMVVNRRGLESLATVLALVGTNSRVRSHVQSQTVRHSERFAANLKTKLVVNIVLQSFEKKKK